MALTGGRLDDFDFRFSIFDSDEPPKTESARPGNISEPMVALWIN